MKKVLPLLVMLSMIIVCQGCSEIIEKTAATYFYLGDNFTVDSIDDKCFESIDNSLNYKINGIDVNSVDAKRKEVGIIINELEDAIKIELTEMNIATNTTYLLGDAIRRNGDVDYGEELIIEFDIEIIENVSRRKIDGTYSFVIEFNDDNTPPPLGLDFYLCDNVTIDSIGDKSFTSDSTYLNYTVNNINSIGKDNDTIVDQLKTVLTTELDKKSIGKSIDYTLESAILSGNILVNGELVIKFGIEIRDITSDSKISGTYSFTIVFNDEVDPWNGIDKTEPDRDIMDNYLIKIPANLAWLSDQVKVDKNVLFLSDIDMGSKPFGGIKEFSGIFDGNNKSIKNINIEIDNDTTSDIATALIQNVTGDSTIKNLILDGGTIRGNRYIGSFVGTVGVEDNISTTVGTDFHKFTIDNLTSDVDLISNNLDTGIVYEVIMGGFVAMIEDRTVIITNSMYSGKIISNSTLKCIMGGIIGKVLNSDITISELINNNDISVGINNTSVNTIGGILGESVIIGTERFNINGFDLINSGNLYNNGNGRGIVGGIIGANKTNNGESTLSIVDSKNEGDIKGVNILGGVIGFSTKALIVISDTYNKGLIEGLVDIDNLAILGSAGGIVGNNEGMELVNISNTYNVGDIGGNFKYTGGLIGRNASWSTTDITDSYNTGDITGNMYTGGIIGESHIDLSMTMLGTYNRGSIISNNSGNSFAGGLIGYNRASSTTLRGSYNTGKLMTNNKVISASIEVIIGGLIGKNQNSAIIENSYNIGNIDMYSSVSDVTIGGIIGSCYTLVMNETYNTGDIISHSIDNSSIASDDIYIGGIVGSVIDRNRDSSVTIMNSYNSGDIESKGTVGGVIGNNNFDSDDHELIISQVFSYGDIYGDKSTGAILGTGIGLSTPIFKDNYWYSQRTPVSDSIQIGGDRLEVDEFKIATNFIDWDFTSDTGIWELKEGADYPTLRGMPVVTP